MRPPDDGGSMHIRRFIFAVALSGALLRGGALSAEGPFPGAEWKHAAPAELGWPEAGLARAFSDEIRSGAVIIVQRGKMVADWGDTKKRMELASVRKSLLSAPIGIAASEHLIHLDRVMQIDAVAQPQ